MSNIILRSYGHLALFLGIVGAGFAIMVIGLNPDKLISWVAGIACVVLGIIGYRTILNN